MMTPTKASEMFFRAFLNRFLTTAGLFRSVTSLMIDRRLNCFSPVGFHSRHPMIGSDSKAFFRVDGQLRLPRQDHCWCFSALVLKSPESSTPKPKPSQLIGVSSSDQRIMEHPPEESNLCDCFCRLGSSPLCLTAYPHHHYHYHHHHHHHPALICFNIVIKSSSICRRDVTDSFSKLLSHFLILPSPDKNN